MQKAFDLIVEKMKEEKTSYYLTIANTGDEKLDAIYKAVGNAIDNDIKIVNKVAEEYKVVTSNDLEIVASLPSLYPMMQDFEEEAILNVVSSIKQEEVCEWTQDCDIHTTKCGHVHAFVDGSMPMEFEYCPYCGKRIKLIQPK